MTLAVRGVSIRFGVVASVANMSGRSGQRESAGLTEVQQQRVYLS